MMQRLIACFFFAFQDKPGEVIDLEIKQNNELPKLCSFRKKWAKKIYNDVCLREAH